VVRLLVHELMTRRGVSAYALSRGANLSYPSAYRLSRPEGRFGRLNADTLERLCTFFKVQPGALLEWVPANGRSQRRKAAGEKKAPAGRSRRPADAG
jgi:DNA-binding Xre family transcriptional regulator